MRYTSHSEKSCATHTVEKPWGIFGNSC